MGNRNFGETVVTKIKNWFKVVERCKRYADKLNQIDHLLSKYEKRYYACMDPVTKKLIKEIDDILE